jgi:hypothetical protein
VAACKLPARDTCNVLFNPNLDPSLTLNRHALLILFAWFGFHDAGVIAKSTFQPYFFLMHSHLISDFSNNSNKVLSYRVLLFLRTKDLWPCHTREFKRIANQQVTNEQSTHESSY